MELNSYRTVFVLWEMKLVRPIGVFSTRGQAKAWARTNKASAHLGEFIVGEPWHDHYVRIGRKLPWARAGYALPPRGFEHLFGGLADDDEGYGEAAARWDQEQEAHRQEGRP